uniref:Uncharacterized protein n=1 Tax=viral metagenome TaxID=1070528 RepID=A0A6C0EY94_9ZZZZ
MSNWTLYDKVMYGGLGYSAFCLPTNFFKIIIAIIFPPIGEILCIIGDEISSNPPFLSWGVIQKLFSAENINKIIYSFILTTLFYIPGLIYTLSNIADSEYTTKF